MFAFPEPALQVEWAVIQPIPATAKASDRDLQAGSIARSNPLPAKGSKSPQPPSAGASELHLVPMAIATKPDAWIAIDPQVPIRPVLELNDVRPSDWAYQALQSLESRLELSPILPNEPPENRVLNRHEFAMALRRLLSRLDERGSESLTTRDLELLQRLQADFARELAIFGDIRLNRLTARIADIEDRQFSPTTTLSGEVIFGVTGILGEDVDSNLVFQQRARLGFTTSFTGKDRLRVNFRVGNFEESSFFDEVTREGRLGFRTNTNNIIKLSDLNYRFPVGKRLRVFISPAGDNVGPVNPRFSSRGTGALSRFGRRNPVYRLIENAGFGLTYEISDAITLDLGYFVGDPEDSRAGNGLFNGDYSTSVRLEIEPNNRLSLGLLYVRSFNGSNLATGTGSLRSQIDLDRPVIGNSFSFEVSFQLDPGLTVGGWIGFTDANVIGLGRASVLNYALTVALPDVGKEGNLLGFVVGQEPRLLGTSGFEIAGSRRDPDPSFHIEAFYRHQIDRRISITPGAIWITAPNHDNRNGDLIIISVRTTYRF